MVAPPEVLEILLFYLYYPWRSTGEALKSGAEVAGRDFGLIE